MKRSIRGCFGLEMEGKTLTPPAPLVRGEQHVQQLADAPSPDRGRAGEGLGFLPYDKNLTALARQNRQNPTLAATLIWQKALRGKQFNHFKFLRQKPIGPYIVNFYSAELRLVIEIDGDSHAEQADYDATRTAFLESHGLRVLRYANRDVMNNLPGVYEHLQIQLEAR